jgi:tetratricopeptide (TPR) repeat protein
MPVYDVTSVRLDSFRTALDKVNRGIGFKTEAFYSGDALYPYLSAVISWRQGDAESLGRFLDNVKTAYAADEDNETVRTMVEELTALSLWMKGDLDEAISTIRRARPDGILFTAYTGVTGRAHPYWLLAEMLIERGSEADIGEAIEWYSHMPYGIAMAHSAPAWERMAELHDQLGHDDEAIRYYGLFIERWKNASPVLQPRVEAARNRMNTLLDEKAREPK